jgi:hypothetical protein
MNKKQRFGSWLAIAAIAIPLLFVSPAQGITPEPTPEEPYPSIDAPTPEQTPPPSEEPAVGVIVPFPEGEVGPDFCMEQEVVIQGPVNEIGTLGLGAPGEVGIIRVSCITALGKEMFYNDHRFVWTVFDIEKTEEVPVETPSDWPWSTERIAEERGYVEWHANVDGVPVVYPPYLRDEFLTTGKIMAYAKGTITAGWVPQP